MLFADALAFLAADAFIGVTNALALVGFRRVVAADLGGELADELFVDAFHLDLGVVRDRDLEVGRDRVEQRMGAAQLEVEVVALDGGAKTDARGFRDPW